MRALTRREVIEYEVSASFWASYIGFPLGQWLAGKWFAFKVSRKLTRYNAVKAAAERAGL